MEKFDKIAYSKLLDTLQDINDKIQAYNASWHECESYGFYLESKQVETVAKIRAMERLSGLLFLN